MGQIWVTSDLHFGHNRDFLWEPRGFNSIYEMNDAIIENWNSIVDMEDDIYVLGDVMLGNNEAGIDMIKQLKGNIHLIRGNHDTDSRMELYNNCYNIVEITEGQFLRYNGYHFYLSHYPCLTANWDGDRPLKKRIISLCGHVHTKDRFYDMNKGIIYHCELDAHNIYPVLMDTIIEDIENYINERNFI